MGMGTTIAQTFLVFGGAFLLTTLYVTAFAPINWPPFYQNPTIGSVPYISVYLVATLITGVIVLLFVRAHKKNAVRTYLERQGIH